MKIAGSFPQASLLLIVALQCCVSAEPAIVPIPDEPLKLPSTQPVQLNPEIVDLVTQTGDVDPAIRQRATEKLIAKGVDVLPELGRVARSDDPEICLRAREVLGKVPWSAPDDPPAVVNMLQNFGAHPVAQRVNIVRRLAATVPPDRSAAWRAMGRIIRGDPDYDVLWEVVTQTRLAKGQSLQLGRMPFALMSGPMKVVFARGDWQHKPLLAIRLYQQALKEDRESDTPLQNRDEIFRALDELTAVQYLQHDLAGAAEAIRGEYPYIPPSRQPHYRQELYLFRGDGDIQGLADDLRKFPPDLGDPPTLYALARIEKNGGNLWMAGVIRGIAFSESCLPLGNALATHAAAGMRVASHGWLDEARQQMDIVLADAPDNDILDRTNANIGLMGLEENAGNYQAAAEDARRELEYLQKHPTLPIYITLRPDVMLHGNESQLQAYMNWSYLRVAAKTHDAALADRASLELARLKPIRDEMLLQAYPYLIDNGHLPEAQEFFDANYKVLRDFANGGAGASLLIRLAWICARCGQHLDEAEQAARRALELEPKSPGCMIALAEVELRKGNARQAVDLAEQALKLVPTDVQIKAHLARYRGVLAKQTGPEPEK